MVVDIDGVEVDYWAVFNNSKTNRVMVAKGGMGKVTAPVFSWPRSVCFREKPCTMSVSLCRIPTG